MDHWHKSPTWNYTLADLRLALIRKASHGTGKVVLLKIPTAKLPHIEKLKIRSQQKLFSYDYYNLDYDTIQNPLYKHIIHGENANFAPLFKQRKEALEYIYPEDISADIIWFYQYIDTHI